MAKKFEQIIIFLYDFSLIFGNFVCRFCVDFWLTFGEFLGHGHFLNRESLS